MNHNNTQEAAIVWRYKVFTWKQPYWDVLHYIACAVLVHCSTFVFPFCLHIQTRAQIQINPQQWSTPASLFLCVRSSWRDRGGFHGGGGGWPRGAEDIHSLYRVHTHKLKTHVLLMRKSKILQLKDQKAVRRSAVCGQRRHFKDQFWWNPEVL